MNEYRAYLEAWNAAHGEADTLTDVETEDLARMLESAPAWGRASTGANGGS